MSNLHIDENTEIGNTGITLKQLLSNVNENRYRKVACFGYYGNDTTNYNSGDRINFYKTIFNNVSNNIITYNTGIIDILGLEKGKHYIKISVNVWIFETNDKGDRPWLQVINVNKNKTYAECISHFSTYYHSMIISDVIVPFDPHTDGTMRLETKVYTGNNIWKMNNGAGGYYNDKNTITLEILELK